LRIKYDKYNNIFCEISREEIEQNGTEAKEYIEKIMNHDEDKSALSHFFYALVGKYHEKFQNTKDEFIDYRVHLNRAADGCILFSAIANEKVVQSSDKASGTLNLGELLEDCGVYATGRDRKRAELVNSYLPEFDKFIEKMNRIASGEITPEDDEYCFEAWADNLDQIITFAKTIDINNPEEAGICVFKDNRTDKYVIPFVADANTPPLNYSEFFAVKPVDEKYWGVEEHRTYITNLGMLAMISVVGR
jgi:hypothetical protein